MDHATGKKKNLAREGERSKDLAYLKRPKKVTIHRWVDPESLTPLLKEVLVEDDGQQGIV